MLIMSRFLLAVLHIEFLASHLNKAQIRSALQKLPQELEDTYQEALQRIVRQGQPSLEMAYQVLSWISYAYRPLTVEELRCALAVTPGRSTFDEDTMTPESSLVSVCAGLVAVDPQSRIIRLVHYTTQEFFEKIRDSIFHDARRDITRTCLTYLSFDHARYDNTRKYDIKKSPFLSYAVQHWRDHMWASPDPKFNEMTLQILSQPKKMDCIFQTMDEPPFNVGMYRDTTVPPLCAAAFLGLESVVLLLLERGADLTESVTSNGSTALVLAVFRAQQEVIKVLLDRGASINRQDRSGWTPLRATCGASFYVSEKRAVAAARLLLDRGAEVDVQYVVDGVTASTLMFAVQFGFVQLAQLLLTYGADVNLRNGEGRTALLTAHTVRTTKSTPRISGLLARHGADINACNGRGSSALLLASDGETEEAEDTVRTLLELGANVH